MRIKLDEVIRRHKECNPNTNYIYDKSVLGKTIHDKIIITCPLHGDFLQAPHEHMKGQQCPECGRLQMMQTKRTNVEDMIAKSVEIFGDKFSYEKTRETYTKFKAKCIFHCNKHNLDFEAQPIHHLSSKTGRCPECGKDVLRESCKLLAKPKDVLLKEFLEKASKRNPYKYDLSFITEYNDSRTKVPIYCNKKDRSGKEHGIFMIEPAAFLCGIGCPRCNRSHFEEKIDILLRDNEIVYEEQKSFKWLGRLRLDFYIQDKNLAIECQGGQHFVEVKRFGGQEQLIAIQSRDQRKRELCKENGVELIYFLDKKYEEYVKDLDNRYFTDVNELIEYVKGKETNVIMENLFTNEKRIEQIKEK